MSLIAPHEWGQYNPGEYLANRRLRADMTWEIDTSDLDEGSNALARARTFIREFVISLSEQGTICESLPFYVKELPYYRRMLATALASSLSRSLPNTGDDIKALIREQPELLSLSGYGSISL